LKVGVILLINESCCGILVPRAATTRRTPEPGSGCCRDQGCRQGRPSSRICLPKPLFSGTAHERQVQVSPSRSTTLQCRRSSQHSKPDWPSDQTHGCSSRRGRLTSMSMVGQHHIEGTRAVRGPAGQLAPTAGLAAFSSQLYSSDTVANPGVFAVH